MTTYYLDSADGNDGDSGLSWDFAKATLAGAYADMSAGDILYVAHDHAETLATTDTTFTSPGTGANPCKIISVDRDNSDAYRKATSQQIGGVTTTPGSNGHINWDGSFIMMGMYAGSGENFRNDAGQHCVWIDCDIENAEGISNPKEGSVEYHGCRFRGAAMSVAEDSYVLVRDCEITSDFTSSFFVNTTSYPAAHIDIRGLDLSAVDVDLFLGSTVSNRRGNGSITAHGVKLHASATMNLPTISNTGYQYFDLSGIVSGSDRILRSFKDMAGAVTDDQATYYAATFDGLNNYSLKFVSTALTGASKGMSTLNQRLRYPIATFYADANATLTMRAYGDHATQLQDDELWWEIEHESEAGLITWVDTLLAGYLAGTAANVATETDPGWVEASAPASGRYYAVSKALANVAGVITVYGCVTCNAAHTVWFDPKVGIS